MGTKLKQDWSGKLATLLDEVIGLVQETRALVKRTQPYDWTLLYGPRGTEIARPDPLTTEIAWKP